MLRHAQAVGATDRLRLAVAARTVMDLPFPDELAAAGSMVALSRAEFAGRPAGRLTVAEIATLVRPGVTGFVCGSAPFTEFASQLLMEQGLAAEALRIERFGPSG